MSFLYFVPGTSRAVPPQFAHAFETTPAIRDIVGAGPGGTAGKLFAAGKYLTDADNFGFYASRQTWHKAGGGCWIGYETDALPTPDQLKRAKTLAGHEMKLGDGRLWTIPVARRFEEGRWQSALPNQMVYDPDTNTWQYSGTVKTYQRLWDIAERWWDMLTDTPDEDGTRNVDISTADGVAWATECLAVNYCVGPVECSVMQLWNDSNIGEVLSAVCDLPTLTAWAKKKSDATPDDLNTTDGEPA